MLLILQEWLGPLLREQELYDLHVLRYVSFRAAMAALTAAGIVVWLGPAVIAWLTRRKIGDVPEFHNATLNRITADKRHVPTMGGVLILAAIVWATLLWADPRNAFVVLGLFTLLAMGALGAVDDWLKLNYRPDSGRSRDGLHMWEKLAFQLGLAGIVSYHLLSVPGFAELADELWLPIRKTPIRLDPALFLLISTLMIAGFSNAVNLTDGMDGLAAGCTSMSASAMAVLCAIAGEFFWIRVTADQVTARYWADFLNMPRVLGAEELTIFCAALAGACVGFLWFNSHPAQVFMGDTGSLALGGGLAFTGVVTRNEWLLMIIGGVFVAEAASVVLQVACFKLTGGKRIFRCAPIHHHFQMGTGDSDRLPEQKVVARFWAAAAMLAVLGLAAVKLR